MLVQLLGCHWNSQPYDWKLLSLGDFKMIMEDHIADKKINKMLSLIGAANFYLGLALAVSVWCERSDTDMNFNLAPYGILECISGFSAKKIITESHH